MPDFGAYQNEIYIAGLSGRLPSFPGAFDELEAKAHAAMPACLISYVAGGCGDERTQEANVEAFERCKNRQFVAEKQKAG
jgi:lactate 2-monooxygenase